MLAALAAAAGALLAVQARVNGALASRIGSAVVAALVSFAVGFAALSVVLVLRGGFVRRRPLRWFWYAGGTGGAFLVAVSAAAVPVIGVALLGVGIVGGQTVGALVVDRLGISPRGHQPLSRWRLLSAAVAVGATVLAAAGRAGSVSAGLLALAALAGFAVAAQQAANGHVQRVYGSPFFAAWVNFGVGTAALLLVVALARPPLSGWPGAPWLYAGGLGGASYIALSAAVVARLGVLRLSLASVAGQLAGGVALDALAPAGRRLDLRTAVAVALTFAAVALAGRH